MTIMGTKDETIHIKIRSDEKDEITEAASRLDIPVSQFLREAAREKVASLKTTEAETAEAA